ncbi:MAG: hypothetical protein Homavirus32_6, partial [Homavirus sp.]
MSQCKPLVFYGTCCTILCLLAVMGAFTKGVGNGISALIG